MSERAAQRSARRWHSRRQLAAKRPHKPGQGCSPVGVLRARQHGLFEVLQQLREAGRSSATEQSWHERQTTAWWPPKLMRSWRAERAVSGEQACTPASLLWRLRIHCKPRTPGAGRALCKPRPGKAGWRAALPPGRTLWQIVCWTSLLVEQARQEGAGL